MDIECLGGPYDGRGIRAIDLQRFVRVMVLRADGVERRFVYLPGPEEWPAVLGGVRGVDDSAIVHYYELIQTSRGIKLVHHAGREHFWQSMDQAIREMSARTGRPGPDGRPDSLD